MDSQALTVRRATLADVNELASLNSVVQDLHVAARPDVFRPTEHSGVSGMFQSGIDQPHNAGWLAEQDGAAVGYVLTTLHDRAGNVVHKPHRVLEIVQIGVLPGYQRRGIGRALLNRVLEHAVASAVDEVVLSSWAFNESAHEAFRRWGFTPRIIEFSLPPRQSID